MEEFDKNVYLPLWAEGMQSLYKWYDNVREGLDEGRNKGLASYTEVLANGMLQTLLEHVRKTKPPNYKGCKEIMKDLGKAIEYEIKFREIDVKVLEGPSSRSKAAKAGFWLTASNELEKKSRKRFAKLYE